MTIMKIIMIQKVITVILAIAVIINVLVITMVINVMTEVVFYYSSFFKTSFYDYE